VAEVNQLGVDSIARSIAMAATSIEFFIRVEKNLFLSQMDTDNCRIKADVFLLTGLWDRAVTPGQGHLPHKRLDVWTALHGLSQWRPQA